MAKSKSTNTSSENPGITRNCVVCEIEFEPTGHQIRFENVRCDKCRDRTKRQGKTRCASYASTMRYYAKLEPEQLEEIRYRKVWRAMVARCHDPNNSSHRSYGARGITVCAQWRASFEAFRGDMGPRPSSKHSIDRKDNDGPYSPENCRWATRKEQALNRRTNTLIEFDGKALTLGEWALVVGVPRLTLLTRITCLKWSVAEALTTPVKETWSRQRRKRT